MDKIKAFIAKHLVLIIAAIIAIGAGLGLGRSEGQTMGDWWQEDEAYVVFSRDQIERMPTDWQARLRVLLDERAAAWPDEVLDHLSYMVIPVFDDAAFFAAQGDLAAETEAEPEPEPEPEDAEEIDPAPSWGWWRPRG